MFGRKKKICDWCDSPFTGQGIRDGEMLFCSTLCLESRNAPPIPTVSSPRPVSKSLVKEDLRIAAASFEEYAGTVSYLLRYGSYGSKTERDMLEQMSVQAEQQVIEAWRSLQDAARSLKTLGADTGEFEQLFLTYCDTASTVTTTSGFASFTVNVDLQRSTEEFEAARRLLRSLLAEVGDGPLANEVI